MRNPHNRHAMKRLVLSVLAGAAFCANAAAASAATRSFGVARPGDDVITFAMNGTKHFHGVNRVGGGFEIVSEDDGRLLAFSSGGEFSETNAAPIWAMLMVDTGAYTPPARTGPLRCASNSMAPVFPEGASVTHARATGVVRLAASASSTSITSDSLITDMRVEPMIKTKWNQGSEIYNYYTPGNAVCGCVATAMAQIMRHHKYPTASVTAKTKACGYNGAVTNLTMKGGTYNWDLMELSPTDSSSNAVKQAIGKLTSDCGISVHMGYTTSSSGSGAFDPMSAMAFTNTWHYAQSQYWDSERTGTEADGGMLETSIQNAILCSLDAGCPVLLGISGTSGGHAIVGDGYGYVDSQRYIHLNMGWSGSYDYWYCFPIKAGGSSFAYLDDFTYNLFPTETGNIISGRITDTDGKGLAGVNVSCHGYIQTYSNRSIKKEPVNRTVTTSKYGVYSVIVPNRTVYITNITATVSGYKPDAIGETVETKTTCSRFLKESEVVSNLSSENPVYSYASSTPTIGNSWGNDLTLSAYLVPEFGATPSLSPTDGSITLVVTTESGVQYRIEWTDDLTSDNWKELCVFNGNGAAQSLEITSEKFDWTEHPSAFFRAAVVE